MNFLSLRLASLTNMGLPTLGLPTLGWATAIAGLVILIIYVIFKHEIKAALEEKKRRSEIRARQAQKEKLNEIKESGFLASEIKARLIRKMLRKQ